MEEGIKLAVDYQMMFGKELPFNAWIDYDNEKYKSMIKKALESGKEIPQEELEALFDTEISEYDLVD